MANLILAAMNTRSKIVFFTILILLSSILSAQEPFRVMFYNVENLYDTINNPHTQDDDFTPEGNLHWNSFRYHRKIEEVSKVISSLGGEYPPAIVGLCEVENDQVMKDLTIHSSLAKHKYRYVITKSKDLRGSNISFLYQRDQFRLLSKKTYSPHFDNIDKYTSRDILHVTGEVVNGDTLDIFICHYPSRSEGIAKSEPFRLTVSKLLKQKVDSLKKKRKTPRVIIMGDFNDYPNNASIKDILKAKEIISKPDPPLLYNLFYGSSNNNEIGSYKYNGKWGFLDQFIVSGSLLDSEKNTHLISNEAYVYSPEFLLDYDEKHGGKKPLRTYSGWKYIGGFSDHLPIYFDLYIKEPID